MNRRHFLVASLPVLLAGPVPIALAQERPAPKPAARRVKIVIALHKPSLNPSDNDDRAIVLVTDENVETYAAFNEMHPFPTVGADGSTTAYQDFGPWVRVRPHIGADGKIKVDVKLAYEQAVPGAATDGPFPTQVTSLTNTRTVEDGQSVLVGGIRLTATILRSLDQEPHELDPDQLTWKPKA